MKNSDKFPLEDLHLYVERLRKLNTDQFVSIPLFLFFQRFGIPDNPNYDMFDWITSNPLLNDKMITQNNAIYLKRLRQLKSRIRDNQKIIRNVEDYYSQRVPEGKTN